MADRTLAKECPETQGDIRISFDVLLSFPAPTTTDMPVTTKEETTNHPTLGKASCTLPSTVLRYQALAL